MALHAVRSELSIEHFDATGALHPPVKRHAPVVPTPAAEPQALELPLPPLQTAVVGAAQPPVNEQACEADAFTAVAQALALVLAAVAVHALAAGAVHPAPVKAQNALLPHPTLSVDRPEQVVVSVGF